MTKSKQARKQAVIEAARRAVRFLEQALYLQPTRRLSADKRFAISMQLSAERTKLAALLGVKLWSADAALASPEEE